MKKERFVKMYAFLQKEALTSFQEFIDKDATAESMVTYIQDVLHDRRSIHPNHEEWIESGECRRLSMSLSFQSNHWGDENTLIVPWSLLKDKVDMKKRLLYLLPNKVIINIDCDTCSEDWLTKHSFLAHLDVRIHPDWLPPGIDFYALAHKYQHLLSWRNQLSNVPDPIIERDAILLWSDDSFVFQDSQVKEEVFKTLLAANRSDQLYEFIDKHLSEDERILWFNQHITIWLSKSIHCSFPRRYLSAMNARSCVLLWAHTNIQERQKNGLDVLDFPELMRPIIEQYKMYKDAGFFDGFVEEEDYFKFFYAGGMKFLDKMIAFYDQHNEDMILQEEVSLW